MIDVETKTAPEAENQKDVQDLQPEVQELNAADAKQVRGGQAIQFHAKPVKIDF